MANTPISGFASGTPAQPNDEYVIARSGANYKLTGTNIKTFIIGAGSASIASGKTLTANNTVTLAGTDGTTMTFPSTSATIARTDAGNTFTGNQIVSNGSFSLSGNISSSAWTTNGIRYANVSGTLTDTSSSGTVATAYTNLFGGNTIAASNITTFTNYYTTWISSPTSGSNVTFTNRWALGLNGPLQSSGQSLTGSQAQSLLDLSTTWNTSGTPTAIKLNITNTSSNANSLLMDLQVGGTSQFNINRSGQIVSPTTNASTVITAPALGAL